MSQREAIAKRYEDMCGLNPKAVGVGGGINREPNYFWKPLSVSLSVDNEEIRANAAKMGVSEQEYIDRLEKSFG